jgi:hypothetical protein
MKALQHLRAGKLVIRTPSYPFLNNVHIDAPGVGYMLREVTAKKLIEKEWVELARFRDREGQYVLTPRGKAETETFCECKRGKNWRLGVGSRVEDYTLLSGTDPATTDPKIDWPKERLLCLVCWRVAPCQGKFFKHLHRANRYVWGIGPICQKHCENPGAK